jgi:two-component system NtrC family sensor kinase
MHRRDLETNVSNETVQAVDMMEYHTPSAYLIPFPVESFSKPVLITATDTTIGRDDDNTLQIAHDAVSRRHAVIQWIDGRFIIKDLESENGTFINDVRVSEAHLAHHDKITIGNRTFLFLLPSHAPGDAAQHLLLNENDTIALSEEDIEPSEMLAQTAQSAVRQLFHQTGAPSPQEMAPKANAHERLTLLYQLSEKLRSTKDAIEILDRGLELILEAIPAANRTMILLRAGAKRPLEVRAIKYRDQQDSTGVIPISRTVLDWVLNERMALVSQDVSDDQRFEDSESIRINNANSLLCVPLLRGDSVLGVLYVESTSYLDALTQDDAAFAAAVANELALSLDNIKLQRQALRNARMAAIGLTITNLAHNIKNLIMLNQNAVDLMGLHLAKLNDPGIARNWQRIQQSFTSINRLSSDMLEYAKENTFQLKDVDINQLILSSRDLFEQGAAGREIELKLTLSPNNPRWVMDEIQLQRALVNLMVNAMDAVGDREKGIIKISSSINNKQQLVITVSDNGCGMKPEQLDRICDLFYTTKGTSGSGLGIPMVQKFVERMGGKLLVKSKAGVGSSFGMVFPKIDK